MNKSSNSKVHSPYNVCNDVMRKDAAGGFGVQFWMLPHTSP